MPFSSDWFAKLAKDNFDTHIKPVYNNRPCKYLEIGSYEGQSLLYMFENVLKNGNSRAVVIDPFGEFDGCTNNSVDIFKSNLKDYLNRTIIIQDYSQNVLPILAPNTFDVIYIDGDHTSEAALRDATLSFPLLKSGGIMVFDDYLWIHNVYTHTNDNISNPEINSTLNPYRGINTFLQQYKDSIEILSVNWQVIIKKL